MAEYHRNRWPTIARNKQSEESSDSSWQSGEPTENGLLERSRHLYHIGDRNSGISAYCENIFVYDEYMYFVFSLSNKSQIRYEMSDVSFVVENGRKSKRFVNMDKTLAVANSYGIQSVAPSGTRSFYYKIPKFTLDKKLVLRIYIYEVIASDQMYHSYHFEMYRL